MTVQLACIDNCHHFLPPSKSSPPCPFLSTLPSLHLQPTTLSPRCILNPLHTSSLHPQPPPLSPHCTLNSLLSPSLRPYPSTLCSLYHQPLHSPLTAPSTPSTLPSLYPQLSPLSLIKPSNLLTSCTVPLPFPRLHSLHCLASSLHSSLPPPFQEAYKFFKNRYNKQLTWGHIKSMQNFWFYGVILGNALVLLGTLLKTTLAFKVSRGTKQPLETLPIQSSFPPVYVPYSNRLRTLFSGRP